MNLLKKGRDIFTLNSKIIGEKQNSFKITLIKIFMYALIIISEIQQMPSFYSYYSIIRNALYLIAFLTILISSTELLKVNMDSFTKFFVIFFLSFQFLSLTGVLLYGDSVDNIGTLFLPITVAFFIYIISFVLYNKANLKVHNILLTYIITTIPIDIDAFKTYFNNNIFISAQYLVGRKGLAFLMGFVIILSIYFILTFTKSKTIKILFLLFSVVFNFLLLNLIRERGMLLELYIAIIILLLKSIKNKNVFLILIVFFVVILFLLAFSPYITDNIVSSIIQPFIKGFNTSNLNNLSSGRIQLFSEAFKTFLDHPIIGTLGIQNYFVDNTFLISLANYGLIGTCLYTILFGFLFYIGIINIIKRSIKDIRLYISIILFNSLMISFTSGIAPFGPGTIYIILWFLLPLITSKRIREV